MRLVQQNWRNTLTCALETVVHWKLLWEQFQQSVLRQAALWGAEKLQHVCNLWGTGGWNMICQIGMHYLLKTT